MITDPGYWLTIVLLAAVTVLTRSVFFLSQREWVLPLWVQRGLRYAPLAALAAVVAPEVLLTQGQWQPSWQDARWYAVVAAAAWYHWRGGVFGTIMVGMGALLALRLGLGW